MREWIGKTLFLSYARAGCRKQLSVKPSASLKGGFLLFMLGNILMSAGAMANLCGDCTPKKSALTPRRQKTTRRLLRPSERYTMTKEQKRIAAIAIADIVRNAADCKESRPSAKALKALAKAAASAIAAGIQRFNESV